MRQRRIELLLASLALATLLAACAGTGSVNVTIAGDDLDLAEGAEVALTVSGTTGDAVEWSSSDAAVATVDATGVVTATGPGDAAITATSTADAGASDAIEVTVHERNATLWAEQFGTVERDTAFAVAVDGNGHTLVAGGTRGALHEPSTSEYDAFVHKYDRDGTELWTRQFEPDVATFVLDVATDDAGNVLLAGETAGDLAGPNEGGIDAFVRKYGPDGNELWTRQFGSGEGDHPYGVAADADGNVLVAGFTRGDVDGPNGGRYDAFVRKYDPEGTKLWAHQFGGSEVDEAMALDVDAHGNVLLAGVTVGVLGESSAGKYDAFVRKYDPEGTELWTHQFGTDEPDYAQGVSVDGAGNVWVAGRTLGALGAPSAGGYDAFVRKLDPDGNESWTRQFGSATPDEARAIATDGGGDALVVGQALGPLDGDHAGGGDAFVHKLEGDGTGVWTEQFGTAEEDRAWDVAVDSHGNARVVGTTTGSLDAGHAGDEDGFVRSYVRH